MLYFDHLLGGLLQGGICLAQDIQYQVQSRADELAQQTGLVAPSYCMLQLTQDSTHMHNRMIMQTIRKTQHFACILCKEGCRMTQERYSVRASSQSSTLGRTNMTKYAYIDSTRRLRGAGKYILAAPDAGEERFSGGAG